MVLDKINNSIKQSQTELEENKYVGGHEGRFQDPAMDEWVTIQSLNQISATLREVNDRINNRVSIVISTILTILSGYFLGKNNWLAMGIMLILLGLWILFQLKKQIKHRNELSKLKPSIIKRCEQYGIDIPKGN